MTSTTPKFQPLIIAFFLASIVLISPPVKADRAGDFDIFIQPVVQTDTKTAGQGNHYTAKQKSQNMSYKVRMDYKGLTKVENVDVIYAIGDARGAGPDKAKFGEKKVPMLNPGDKIEFETDTVENKYMEYKYNNYQEQIGKGELKGLAIRVLHEKEVLLDWAKPDQAKDYWKYKPEDHQDSKDDENQRRPRRMRRL